MKGLQKEFQEIESNEKSYSIESVTEYLSDNKVINQTESKLINDLYKNIESLTHNYSLNPEEQDEEVVRLIDDFADSFAHRKDNYFLLLVALVVLNNYSIYPYQDKDNYTELMNKAIFYIFPNIESSIFSFTNEIESDRLGNFFDLFCQKEGKLARSLNKIFKNMGYIRGSQEAGSEEYYDVLNVVDYFFFSLSSYYNSKGDSLRLAEYYSDYSNGLYKAASVPTTDDVDIIFNILYSRMVPNEHNNINRTADIASFFKVVGCLLLKSNNKDSIFNDVHLIQDYQEDIYENKGVLFNLTNAIYNISFSKPKYFTVDEKGNFLVLTKGNEIEIYDNLLDKIDDIAKIKVYEDIFNYCTNKLNLDNQVAFVAVYIVHDLKKQDLVNKALLSKSGVLYTNKEKHRIELPFDIEKMCESYIASISEKDFANLGIKIEERQAVNIDSYFKQIILDKKESRLNNNVPGSGIFNPSKVELNKLDQVRSIR